MVEAFRYGKMGQSTKEVGYTERLMATGDLFIAKAIFTRGAGKMTWRMGMVSTIILQVLSMKGNG